MKSSFFSSSRSRGFTLVEMLVVIAILGILVALLVPGLNKAKEVAEAMRNTSNLKQISAGTINWASDNRGRLPSPEYPGGIEPPSGVDPEDFFPANYNLGESGLWLDGVVFAEVYLKEDKDGEVSDYQVDEEGTHLKGTYFESTQSVKKDPLEKDWHKHSYAMNANLQYDRINEKSSDPYLTEKTLSNLLFAPNAMLYIECSETNVVMYEDLQSIIDTIEKRWDGSKVIVAYLDGHAERLSEKQIPADDPESNIEASRFWRGVDAKR